MPDRKTKRLFRFSLRTLLLFPAGVAILLSAAYWWPKSKPLSLHAEHYAGYYRGLGLIGETGYFGTNFFRIRFEDEFGYWTVDYDGREVPGYYPYRGYYPNGQLREEGEILVEHNSGPDDPMPDEHNVRWGRYYTPDGQLASSIADGTGIQMYFYPDGTKRWELELKDYQRLRHSKWHSNGQLEFSGSYRDGIRDGKTSSFYANGKLKVQGEYRLGRRVGEWTWFDEDERVESKTASQASSP